LVINLLLYSKLSISRVLNFVGYYIDTFINVQE
jgi:hypothetical protein